MRHHSSENGTDLIISISVSIVRLHEIRVNFEIVLNYGFVMYFLAVMLSMMSRGIFASFAGPCLLFSSKFDSWGPTSTKLKPGLMVYLSSPRALTKRFICSLMSFSLYCS